MKNNPKFVTFGELLLRFSKPGTLRLTQADLFTAQFGGSEANVAVSLAALGNRVEYITRLPSNPIGNAGKMRLQELGVDCNHVLRGGDRIGCYYAEPAAGMRSVKVIYDRAHSAYSELKPGMIDWHDVLKDASVLAVSGITAAISQDAADATFEALRVAKEMGVTIAFDINYRKNLWKYGADARETLSEMLEQADVMFGDVIEFEFITGHTAPLFNATDTHFTMPLNEYADWFNEIHRRFPHCKKWLMGMRNLINSRHHVLTALLWSEGTLLHAPLIDIPEVVDPVGVGDAFMAGFLHTHYAFPDDDQRALNYSLCAAALKNTIPGDFNLSTDEEVKEVMSQYI